VPSSSLARRSWVRQVGGMKKVLDKARHDLHVLQNGGVDAVMFSNEFSLPYLTTVRTETTASMARVIGELMNEISIPFGVNVLWDPKASIDLAAATGAKFVREIFTGVYSSDFGLWDTNVGDVVRHRSHLRTGDVKLLFNIVPEAAKYVGDSRRTPVFAKTRVSPATLATIFNVSSFTFFMKALTRISSTAFSNLPSTLKVVPTTAPDAMLSCSSFGNQFERLPLIRTHREHLRRNLL
jgi:membrane complex biogenesis BtpA family protein